VTISTTGQTIASTDSLVLTFPQNTNSALDDKVHSCVIEGTPNVQLFCRMKENRELTINGFLTPIAPGVSRNILIDGLEIGSGPVGYFYIRLFDKDNVLKESRAIGTPIAISDLTSTYTRVYDLLFSSLFVRATTNMSYKFKTLTDPLVSGDRIHVWLEHFYYEYVILPLNLDC
jgi:hypothetical protein